MAFNGCYFSFDGIPCTEYGLMLYDIGTKSSDTTTDLSVNTEIVEDRIARRYTPLHYGTITNEPLEFTMTFGADINAIDKGEYLDRWDLETIARWLTAHNKYKWLEITQPDMEMFRYKCFITDLKHIDVANLPWAFSCKVICDSPFAYQYPEVFRYVVNGTTEVELLNKSSYRGFYKPKMVLFLPRGGSVDVSLLETALTHGYDDKLLRDIDHYPLFVLDHGGGYNYFSLKESTTNIRKTIYASLQEQSMSLVFSAGMALVETMGLEEHNMTLSVSGDITRIMTLTTPNLSAKLKNQIKANMTNLCELIMNATGVHWLDGYLHEYDDRLLSDMYVTYPNMSLVSMCDKVYMKFSFEPEGHNMSLDGSAPDFVTTSIIKDAVRSVMQLDSGTSFEYEVVIGCNPMDTSLNSSEVSLNVIAYMYPEAIETSFSNRTVRDIHTKSALAVTSQSRLNTSVTEEIEMYYGLGHFDRNYLYYWDTYTIEDMSAEITVRSQGGSVDNN
ncbi:MAG: hypothetical protein Q4C12_00135 [Clostridia bacterium]|nr:hypothetical protein [Clostridia bacterium]